MTSTIHFVDGIFVYMKDKIAAAYEDARHAKII